jgi:L-aminopeptidase/D-esterase-like protein
VNNLLTDVAGLRVGHAQDDRLRSGVTCVLFDTPAIAAASLLGGAPAARETALLGLDMTVERIHAVVLSGGSTFGLDATAGVQAALREDFAHLPPSIATRIPLVVQASLFDLTNGGEKAWGRYAPYADFGYAAARAASAEIFALGSAGAGTGATTATAKGGLGSASMVTPEGSTVAALVAVNAIGSATVGDTAHFWAAPFEQGQEFGGLGPKPHVVPEDLQLRMKPRAWGTTIGIVATDAALTAQQAHRLAIAGQDGVARAVLPAHLAGDGDIIFAAATATRPPVTSMEHLSELCLAATLVTARAIARGIFEARSSGLPGEQDSWRARFGHQPAKP